MMTPQWPVAWEHDIRPHTVLGDPTWMDVNFTLRVRLSGPADVAGVGVRCTLMNQTGYQALMLEIPLPGLWLSLNATGGWAVWPSVAAFTNYSAPPLAQGTLPGGATLPPGTWATVTLVASGGSLSATVDGAPVFTNLNVGSLPATGWVGLATGDYGHFVDVDDVMVAVPSS
jgi:hypothetical protein